jgi:DNA-binding CsgD family transcriptional regulator
MISPADLRRVADDTLAAALLGTGWTSVLARLAAAASAGGAVLTRYEGKRLLAMISTESLAEPVRDFVAGRAPAGARHDLPVRPTELGFRADFDDFDASLLRNDPYYQDFLRPIGYFWHANIGFRFGTGEEIELSLKREARHGHYEPADIAQLNTQSRNLRTSMRVARQVLDAEAAGIVKMVHQRGDPVFELDSWGRVLRTHQVHACPASVTVIGRRLVAVDKLAQAPLDRAILTATTVPRQPALAIAWDHDGHRVFLQVIPVTGDARDVFHGTAAVAVLIDPAPNPDISERLAETIQSAFGLTRREAQVAVLLGQGLSLEAIAAHLGLQIGTSRNRLKSVFDKTRTTRQAELVALLRALSP